MSRSGSTILAITLLVVFATACSEEGSPSTEALMPDSVDQVVFGFTNHFTVDGVERAQLQADSAYHFEGEEKWELFNLRVEFRSPQGALRSTLTSLRGTYNWNTGDMEARDSVVAVTPDQRRLTTCALEYTDDSDIIAGPCAFVFDAENEHLEGESFTADPDFRNVTAVRPSSGTVRDANALPGN
jgi:LPS export ABC transporter protein LptC